MPELPEVETTKNSIAPFLSHQSIKSITLYRSQLRYRIPTDIDTLSREQTIERVDRIAKYLLIILQRHILLIHLGMSGSLTIVTNQEPLKKHDHYEIELHNGTRIRYNDPRRFGLLLITPKENYQQHFLISHLGVEPLSRKWHTSYLYHTAIQKRVAIKNLLMNNKIVVGIGNIYCNEILFLSQIYPLTPTYEISKQQAQNIIKHSKKILKKAIQTGGTTLRDYRNGQGKIGYFQQQLWVYNRTNAPCKKCHTPIQRVIQGGRSSFFCPYCQNPPM